MVCQMIILNALRVTAVVLGSVAITSVLLGPHYKRLYIYTAE